MAELLTIQIEQQQIRELLARLDPKQLRQAEYQIVTRTTRNLAKQVAAESKKLLTLKSFGAKKIITSKLPTRATPVGKVMITDTRVPAIWYMTERTVNNRLSRRGRGSLSIRFRKDKPAIRFPHYFLATVSSAAQQAQGIAHTGVFGRSKHLPTKGENAGKGRLTSSGFAGRLAIKEVHGPSPYDLLMEDGKLTGIAERLLAESREKMLEYARGQIYRFTGERIVSVEGTAGIDPAGEGI